MPRPIRLGTRGSRLALRQAEIVAEAVRRTGRVVESVTIRTSGDDAPDLPLSALDAPGFFTKQLDLALLEGRVDLAVHSLKDLPTLPTEGIRIAAIGTREDPSDALVGRAPLRWEDLPPGATVATCSLRRRAQLLHARPDLVVTEIRGNVETRLAKLDESDWAATILAVAGLRRLGLEGRIGERLPVAVMLPAPGQGALAVTARAEDMDTAVTVRRALHDEATALAVSAERALLRRVEGGCQVPLGALATAGWESDGWRVGLEARVLSLDGRDAVEGRRLGSVGDEAQAEALGAALGETLLARGADRILRAVRVT